MILNHDGSLIHVLELPSFTSWKFTTRVVEGFFHSLWFNYWQFILVVSDRNLIVAVSIPCGLFQILFYFISFSTNEVCCVCLEVEVLLHTREKTTFSK